MIDKNQFMKDQLTLCGDRFKTEIIEKDGYSNKTRIV